MIIIVFNNDLVITDVLVITSDLLITDDLVVTSDLVITSDQKTHTELTVLFTSDLGPVPSRLHQVDGDALVPQVMSQTVGPALHTTLGHRVYGREDWESPYSATCDDDSALTLTHQW